ncbi:NAD(P)/FAD-dependent oxidoreductase [Gallaecimonas kandeliae]|uniref:NAD(P)/FAD-dependent oxidoreductase n=1 Tax=Gallaecimonas kandeliae TaxID=3029055 RepID=UPI002649F37E|nr:NAD(P)/FAD-dependent oxidoreductase [Gallaecimonas kandeliae]WKE65764.1 NAD(P)/FAD-dependent oxidoreductase [Gallaecimonas kandeliae]
MAQFDVVIIGAGAAGLMCAAQAGYRGRSVLVLDHAKQAGKKILISGGGRCNFTNINASPANYLCSNPHFVKSALARYKAQDFIELVERHGVAYHEKTLGQLFCDDSAKDIVQLLLTECDWAGVTVRLRSHVADIQKTGSGFSLSANGETIHCQSLVVACGGLSMPKLCATPLGYQIAQQFGLKVLPTRAGLVPFTLDKPDLEPLAELAGVSLPVTAQSQDGTLFKEAMLFTHRGLSGPAILQISSFWQPGEDVSLNLLPDTDLAQVLTAMGAKHPNQTLKTALARLLPKRLVEVLAEQGSIDGELPLKALDEGRMKKLVQMLSAYRVHPNGTEGYRTAEVTLGGVDTDELSSKTLEAKQVPGLYFIGEVMDVTGWLGGYNFQWAWASGWAAGQAV